MKALFKILSRRLKSRNPKFFTYLATAAAIIAMVFFGADKVVDLSPWISDIVLHTVYVACVSVAAVAQLPVSDTSKHHKHVSERNDDRREEKPKKHKHHAKKIGNEEELEEEEMIELKEKHSEQKKTRNEQRLERKVERLEKKLNKSK